MTKRVSFAAWFCVLATGLARAQELPASLPSLPETAQAAFSSPRELLDAYLDRRWLPAEEAQAATEAIVAQLTEAGCTLNDVETMLRAGRQGFAPPPTGKLTLVKGLTCEHVDYQTSFFLYLPTSIDAAAPAPLLLVGHGAAL